MGTCGLLCLAGPVSVGVRSRALLGSTEQERTVGAGEGGTFQLGGGLGNVSGCDSYGRSLSAFSVFLRRKPRLEVWLSNAHMLTHACFSAPPQAPCGSAGHSPLGRQKMPWQPWALRLGALRSDRPRFESRYLSLPQFRHLKVGLLKPPTRVIDFKNSTN